MAAKLTTMHNTSLCTKWRLQVLPSLFGGNASFSSSAAFDGTGHYCRSESVRYCTGDPMPSRLGPDHAICVLDVSVS
jgi:hypothetical protein